MADAAVTFLLEYLTRLLESDVHLIAGAENELKQLKNELDSFKAFLDMAEKDETFTVLERWIKEVVYEAEDSIDAYLTQVEAAKENRFIRGSRSTTRLSLANQIKYLREDKMMPMFDKVKIDFANKQIGRVSSRGAEERSTKIKKIQLIREDNIVGFKDDEETIIKYLNEERDELDVISITGMPGQGKTTLAWKIYQNEKIQYEFPIRIWVYVSQDFNQRDLFLNILKGFTRQDLSSMSDFDLKQTVSAYLGKGKFLLVMDDVWTIEAWDAIKIVLPMNNGMGKVLITSPHWNVCMHTNVTREPHKLSFLNENESWELLQLEVFGKLDGCPRELEEIGTIIAKQSHGLPLSLVVIGGILTEELLFTQPINVIQSAWRKLSENANKHVRMDKQNRPSDIIALSYKNLSWHLRDCFLYLGVFPEDYEIPVWTLARLWIAEGFIQRKEGQTLEETAEVYLKDLINNNLVMVCKAEVNGKVKACRVHSVIREFCKSEAAIDRQNLFQEIKKYNGAFQPPVSDIEKYRRICVHSHLSDVLSQFLTGKLNGPQVRSLLCFYKEPIRLEPKYLSTIPDTFNLLRVLDSRSIIFNQFPRKVTRLIHLRYLTLSFDNLNILPAALSSLWNLQTLVVDARSRIIEIKADIWKMIQLRHLKTKAEIILPVQEEGEGGENLQTLSRLSPRCCTPNLFKRACNLKQLGIRGDITILLKNGMSFEELYCLETLKLKHDLVYESAFENPLPSLPPANCFPQNIKRLTLSATFLDWKNMSTLAMIGTLEVLKLKDNAFTGMSWNVGAAFPCLQLLLIETADLEFWEASNDHFPSLWCLVLKSCEKLSSIPLGLAKSLQILHIECVNEAVVESARKFAEERKQMKGQNQAARGGFKLNIGPGCYIPN